VAAPDVTADDVTWALDEFDTLGRREFLAKYGFGEARSYFIRRDGKDYDSKAIVGAAHSRRHGVPLRASDFSGGEATVKRILEDLGFIVDVQPDRTTSSPRSRPWTYGEVVLACELVADNEWQYLRRTDPHVLALSELLRGMFPRDAAVRDDFRSASSVARKTADIATQHPDYAGIPTRGGSHDRRVLQAFLAEEGRMRAEAAAIRQAALAPPIADADSPDLDLSVEYDEGRSFERRHIARERDPRAREAKIAAVYAATGAVACEVCAFDFAATYGERGSLFAECHHRDPLSVVGETRTRLEDLALLCSNCHRMIHRYRPWLTVEQLRAIVAGAHE
jgi:5-methylcytosine-specific restriction enzyme A